jgi:DNA invertase Pin-like site-specific DNA recombinase
MDVKNVIELIRVSTAGQAAEDRSGIAAQKMVNRRTADLNGLRIVRQIAIVDVKGADILQSPDFQELLRAIESPDIHGVVTKEFTRLMRPDDFADFVILARFVATNTLLYLPDGAIDFSTPAGHLLGLMRAGMAGMEAIEIRNRTNDAKEAKRLAGQLAGGRNTLPYGVTYDRKSSKWGFDSSKANKVKSAFRRVLAGEWNFAKIARDLRIPRTSLRYILENRIYVGVRAYELMRDPHGHVRGPDGRRKYTKKIRRPENRRFAREVLPPLISPQDFERVQQILRLKTKNHWRSQQKARPHYLFAGFLWCKRCGSRMYGHTSIKPHYVCKACTTRERRRREANGLPRCDAGYVLRDRLEKSLNELLSKRLLQESSLRAVIRRLKRHSDSTPRVSPDVIQADLDRLRRRREHIKQSYWDSGGRFSWDETRIELDRIAAELESLESLSADARQAEAQNAMLTPDLIRSVLRPLAQWRFLAPEDRIGILRQLGTRIVIDRYTIASVEFEILGSETEGGRSPPAQTRFKLALPLTD